MKKEFHDLRFFAFLFIGCLLFLALILTGCAGSQEPPAAETEPGAQAQPQAPEQDQPLSSGETETRYKVESIRMPDSLDSGSKIALWDNTLFVAGGYETPALFAKDLPDGAWRQIDLKLSAPEIPAGEDGTDEAPDEDAAEAEEAPEMEPYSFTDISGLAASEEGVFVLTNTYTELGSETRLSIYDKADGTPLSSTALEGNLYVSSIVPVDGGVALLGRYGSSTVYSAQGEPLAQIENPGEILGTAMADGVLYVFTKPLVDYENLPLGAEVDETVSLNRMDPQTHELELLCTVPDYQLYGSLSYTSENGLFLADYYGLRTLDAQTGEATPVTDWLDCGINLAARGPALCVDKDGALYLLVSKDLYKLTAYEGAARQELNLVIGAGGTGIYLDQAVSIFNRQSETHVAKLTYVSPEEMQKLIVEVTSGKGPDIIALGSTVDRENQFSRFSLNSNLCEDLLPYLEADPDYSPDSFLPGVLESRMKDGHLYCLDPGARLLTMTVPASRANEDWSIDRLLEMNSGLEDGLKLFDIYDSSSLLEFFCQLSSVEYIDWAAGTCRFDSSPSFARWLELCKFYVERDARREMEAQALGVDIWELPEEAPILDIGTVHSGQSGYVREHVFLGQDDVAYVGLPGEGENIQVLQGLDRFMMLASSQNKQAAWEFLRTFLSFEVQTGPVPGFGCSPITKEAYDWWVQKNMASEWNDFTEEDGERIKAAIAQAKGTVNTSTVTDIILEEAQKYFDGQRTLEETVSAIQSKAKLYVAEQMW